jgi:Histone acetylation protein
LIHVTTKHVNVQDVLKDAIENNLTSATEMPYFEGDFWPNILEESIKELEQEEEEKRKREEVEAASTAEVEEPAPEKEEAGEVSYTSCCNRSAHLVLRLVSLRVRLQH